MKKGDINISKNTVNNIDTASMFNCELGEMVRQLVSSRLRQKSNGAAKSAAYQAFMSTISPDNQKLSQQYSGNWKDLRFNLRLSGSDRKMLNSIWDHYANQKRVWLRGL